MQTSYVSRSGSSNITLSCSINAYPDVISVTWYKNELAVNTQVPVGKFLGGSGATPNLTILNIVPGDAGTYHCRAGNVVGNSSSTAIKFDVICEWQCSEVKFNIL